jgi:hypothetical protein
MMTVFLVDFAVVAVVDFAILMPVDLSVPTCRFVCSFGARQQNFF